jgi:hypothetical protein
MDFLGRIGSWIAKWFGGGEVDLQKIVNQTEIFTTRVFLIAFLVLAALVAAGLSEGGGIQFVIWALIGAAASAIIGCALGLLFGLPTAEGKRTIVVSGQAAPAPPPAANAAAPAAGEPAAPPVQAPLAAAATQIQEDFETGYRDSTSLEQIADWLTKIIVGLTLTQYDSWEERFHELASNLTAAMTGPSQMCSRNLEALEGAALERMLGSPICQSSPIPGGVIIALFATSGFLIAYLWMRRYFILEMVIARKQAKDLLAANRAEIRRDTENKIREAETEKKVADQQKAIEAAREANLAETDPKRPIATDPEIIQILSRALARMPEGSKAHAALQKVQEKVSNQETDLDDPWKGKFGEAAARKDVRLDASVSPIANDPYFFEVDLCVHAETAERQSELAGTKVLYFLHPTFDGQPRLSLFGSDGKAPLELYAYGAFTVGAVLEDGTLLELNLATLAGAPNRFLAL